jgi:predicted RND superfamily exporter protein
MPLVMQPIIEIKQASEPAINKLENSSIDLVGSCWVILFFLILCVFRNALFALCLILLKVGLLVSFAYMTYIFLWN